MKMMEYTEPSAIRIKELLESVVSEDSYGNQVIRVDTGVESRRIKMQYDSDGNLIYVGINEDPDASDTAPNWTIKKMYYDVNGNLLEIRVKVGAWNERTTLF